MFPPVVDDDRNQINSTISLFVVCGSTNELNSDKLVGCLFFSLNRKFTRAHSRAYSRASFLSRITKIDRRRSGRQLVIVCIVAGGMFSLKIKNTKLSCVLGVISFYLFHLKCVIT